ncbi:MAG: ATP-binding cassette domain-containing protein [Deltaproteobacteria bacterium]|nr:ATP-binding cassette domain-containing protein [Deltaproteobacteria bacterium]
MTENAIVVEAKHLVKKYGALTAVDGISFQIKKSECFGFLGPNGAGKTTTMRMIYGFSPLTEGSLSLFGLSVASDMREIKRRIGVSPQELSLDPDLDVFQNLLIYARYFDLPSKRAKERAHELLEFCHLKEKIHEKIDRLSGGMKRRLVVARALINQPELLILDEPTTGLDPQSRHVMWEKLRALRGQGVTIVLTTHYMQEAHELCDRIAVIDFGKIIEEGKPGELIQKHGVKDLEELFIKLTGKELRD